MRKKTRNRRLQEFTRNQGLSSAQIIEDPYSDYDGTHIFHRDNMHTHITVQGDNNSSDQNKVQI